MTVHLLDQIDRWTGPQGHPPHDLSPEASAWFCELSQKSKLSTEMDWPFGQVYPHLTRLINHQAAGDGWSLELDLMVGRFGDTMPLSAALLSQLQARVTEGPRARRSSDQ